MPFVEKEGKKSKKYYMMVIITQTTKELTRLTKQKNTADISDFMNETHIKDHMYYQ